MAAVIHSLWERNDGSLLILPGTLPIDDPNVQQELTRYLADNWAPIIELDVDGPSSVPLKLDRANPNLGRYSATRRVARTVFLGSAPIAQSANPGLDERHIKLGCVQPGESIATFGDALRRLTNEATHLYVDRTRYWFSTQPSVTRLAQDRAGEFEKDLDVVWTELKNRLRADRHRGDLAAVHVAPEGSADMPDEKEARLVVLGPEYPHVSRASDSPGLQQARQMLAWRGNSPRIYQNMLLFLAPDDRRLTELKEALASHLAWKSIYDDRDILNLDTFQRNQAKTKMEQANETVDARIRETYIWLLVPEQTDPRDQASLTWEAIRLQGNDPLAVRASKKLITNESLITNYSAVRLRLAMDRYNLWGAGDHIGIKQLWEYFARYLYLSRLRDQSVLIKAVQDGFNQTTWAENFAYADSWDDVKKRYLGLKAGQSGSVHFDSESMIVKPEAAQRQLEQEEPTMPPPGHGGDGPDGGRPGGETPQPPQPQREFHRFYGSVQLDPLQAPLQVKTISAEIIQHLQSLMDAEVTISLEIEAHFPDAVPEQVIRTVSENARTLKFRSFEFEA